MRKLYEINKSIEDLLNAVTDPETGEVTDIEALDSLFMEREQKIENVILYYKDVNAELNALYGEIGTLNDRADRLERTAEGLKIYIGKALEGQKFKTSKCEVSYRKSETAEVDDQEKFIEWAKMAENTEVLKHKEADLPDKMAIKKLLKAGNTIPYCHLETHNNISIK